MTTYANQGPGHAGAAVTMAAPSGTASDSTPTGDHFGLLVNNVGSAAISVVLPLTVTYDGLSISNRVVSVNGTAATGSALGGWEMIYAVRGVRRRRAGGPVLHGQQRDRRVGADPLDADAGAPGDRRGVRRPRPVGAAVAAVRVDRQGRGGRGQSAGKSKSTSAAGNTAEVPKPAGE